MEATRDSRHDIYDKGENKFRRRLKWMAAVLVENGNAGGSLVYFSSSMLPSTSPIQLEDARNNRLHEGLSSALRACEASYDPRDDAGLGCPEIFALQEAMSNRPQLPGDQDSRFSGFLSVCGRGEFNGRGVAQLKKSCPVSEANMNGAFNHWSTSINRSDPEESSSLGLCANAR